MSPLLTFQGAAAYPSAVGFVNFFSYGIHIPVTTSPLPLPTVVYRFFSSSYYPQEEFMSSSPFLAQARQHLAVATSLFALITNLGAPPSAAAQDQPSTATPIKHVIVIIGENRTFDHVSATYKPKSSDTSQPAVQGHCQ